jgi:hypothetical protein
MTAEDQILFLQNFQRVLTEGSFTSTYKYALLCAIADLSVELGEESNAPLELKLADIAEKVIEYYWRHATPYVARDGPAILRQNNDRQAAIITDIAVARANLDLSLAAYRRSDSWLPLIRRVARRLKEMPVRYLQNVGGGAIPFLYATENIHNSLTLKPGVAYCFRQFYQLIQESVRSAWSRDVRMLNSGLLGEVLDLREFLFGAERQALGCMRTALEEIQKRCCFYCGKPLRSVNVDHFVPWTRYPLDLAHNFVLSDKVCNSQKRDTIAHISHLRRWVARNAEFGAGITEAVGSVMVSDLGTTNRIASWAYAQTESAHGLTWLGGTTLTELDSGWRTLLPEI